MSLARMKLKLDKLAQLSHLAKDLEDASPAERRAIERKIDVAIEDLARLLQPAQDRKGKTIPATQPEI
jgi:hypothetical protein